MKANRLNQLWCSQLVIPAADFLNHLPALLYFRVRRYGWSRTTAARRGGLTVGFGATARQTAGVTLIDIRGSLTLDEASALGEMIHELVAKGYKKFVLNLRDVVYLDSSGIAQLVSGYATVKRHGGQLKILHLSEKVQDLLSVTGLYKVFEEFSDEQTAVDSFQ